MHKARLQAHFGFWFRGGETYVRNFKLRISAISVEKKKRKEKTFFPTRPHQVYAIPASNDWVCPLPLLWGKVCIWHGANLFALSRLVKLHCVDADTVFRAALAESVKTKNNKSPITGAMPWTCPVFSWAADLPHTCGIGSFLSHRHVWFETSFGLIWSQCCL